MAGERCHHYANCAFVHFIMQKSKTITYHRVVDFVVVKIMRALEMDYMHLVVEKRIQLRKLHCVELLYTFLVRKKINRIND